MMILLLNVRCWLRRLSRFRGGLRDQTATAHCARSLVSRRKAFRLVLSSGSVGRGCEPRPANFEVRRLLPLAAQIVLPLLRRGLLR